MANCPNILNIYYSQKELKHFGLEILVSLEYCFKYFQVYILIHLYQNQKRKRFIYKNFELYQGSQRFQYSQIAYFKSITQ